jgi:cytochrome c-type biogenesis protein
MIGNVLFQYQDYIRIAGGILVIILGVHISGIYRLKFLDFEKRMHMTQKPVHFLGAFVVGMAFGAGWSPCVGPFLGSILAIAASQQTVGRGVALLAVYSAGMAIPFMILSAFVHLILTFVRRGTRYMRYINAAAGVILIAVGALLIADKMNIMI